MTLSTKRELLYGGPLSQARHVYRTYLGLEAAGQGSTREAAEQDAATTLGNAQRYLCAASVVRVAKDGAIIVFRQTGPDTSMYEHYGPGKRPSGCCMGRMTDGTHEYRSLHEYADYVVAQYDGATAEVAS